MAFCAVLYSNDGSFQCTPDHAVEAAYLLSMAEGAVIHGADRFDILETIWDYLDGRKSAAEATAFLGELCGEVQAMAEPVGLGDGEVAPV
jgi:hypothetical protein